MLLWQRSCDEDFRYFFENMAKEEKNIYIYNVNEQLHIITDITHIRFFMQNF